MGPLVIPAIAAGAQLISSGGQAYAQGKMNKKTREWNEKMYGKQREDAMADWNMQNSYNSPAEQMARLRAAGLNPNLVYDNGATHTAAPVRSTEIKQWSPQTPDIAGIPGAVSQSIAAVQDYTLQSEQIKNMAAQRDNMRLDAIMKGVEIAGAEVKNAQSSLDLDKSKSLYDTSIQAAKEALRAVTVGTDIKASQEVRDAALHAPNLATALERVANLSANTANAKAQLDNIKKTGVLQQMEINMRKLGLSYSDGVILRMLAQFAQGQSLPELVKDLWSKLRGLGDEWNKSNPSKDKVTTSPY